MTEPVYPEIPTEPVGAAADTATVRRNRRWPWIFGVAVAFGAGVGIGLATTPSEDENQARIDAALVSERAALAAQRAEADGMAVDADKAADDAAAAMKKAQETQAAADQHAVTVNAQLDERKQQLDGREARLAPREADAARSTFGSGLHRVGVDINPGTYRTTGSTYCYWERLSGTSGEFDDLIANDVPSGPSVVTIAPSDAAFKSQDCGTWTKTS
ncbi:hypothetical protein [Rhodococcus jostii]|uniref:Uncharacterized protein n=1 Tax=Rhodococcus jostii TaxID=132919 RepID=A0A1H4WWZ1_RHOJO|nr:hypothetical protein [Rhodococcus jostii]SEC97131.1 hypothetical protein SAMN04490220_3088 [Rhodococcus jostii]